MAKVYLLKADQTQNIDDIPNIHKIGIHDYEDISQVLASEKYQFNETKIVARANFTQLTKFDFIANNLNIPVLSRRFIEILSLDNSQYLTLIPLKLIDDTFLEPIFKENRILNENIPSRDDFFSIKFNQQFDLCNKELSIFKSLRSMPDKLGILRKPVLNTPKEGFPNIFRIKDSISLLFISETLKSKLESNNIKGCVFEKVETTL